jgi:predicted transposase/invertase (TIGR01784 family)
MKTMEEIDVWYDAQMSNAELKGELKGKLEGEQLQKQEIALKMLAKNLPLETISEVTGLTIEQLQQLESSQNNS